MNSLIQLIKALEENGAVGFLVLFFGFFLVAILCICIDGMWKRYQKEKTKRTLIKAGRMDEYLKLEAKDKE